MSESGIIDLMLFYGSTPLSISTSYGLLTGSQQLPQRFALGYHQCRYSYMNQSDVLSVDGGMDAHGMPYDVMWLDIDHTSGYRYFTWNYTRFPDPVGMQKLLAGKGRQMVTIKDPHLAVDKGYKVYMGAHEKGLLIKRAGGKEDYEGMCWPSTLGPDHPNTTWVDFHNPAARAYWATQFTAANYANSTSTLWTWNDMNEIASFGGPDKSIPRDSIHYNNVEERDVHNMYGFLHHIATYDGHLVRDKDARPFVLTRSYFAGSQR
ncbi:hypothetical protein HK104_007973, partial [Borealophlyctis nickersoniae]